MSRKQYNSANESKDIEELSRSLSEDLRKSINAITVTPPFKPQWICTARTLDRLARVAEAEKRVSTSPNSMWEGQEQCLRFLLESGKLPEYVFENICLTLATQYLVARSNGQALILESCTVEDCEMFEYGVGILLANAWAHKEAIQVTKLQSFFELTELIFLSKLPRVRSGTKRLLGSTVLRFVEAIASVTVGPSERHIVQEALRNKFFEGLFLHLKACHATAAPEDVTAAIDGLATLISCEEFATAKADAVVSKDALEAARVVESEVIDVMCKGADAVRRRRLRELRDFCSYLRRTSATTTAIAT